MRNSRHWIPDCLSRELGFRIPRAVFLIFQPFCSKNLLDSGIGISLHVACSRLRDGGGKSFSNKKCEKRAGAGERQGGGLISLSHFLRRHCPRPFPESCASYFRFTRFNMLPLYYLRAWHRLLYMVRHKRKTIKFDVVRKRPALKKILIS